MADEAEPDALGELIEAQLRFLREGGDAPDTSDLDVEALRTASQVFEVMEALVNAGPKSPALGNDPIAIRLGLVVPPSGEPAPEASTPNDPVTAAVSEIMRRFTVEASPATTDGTNFERRFECRSLVENVLVVVVPDNVGAASMATHARGAFVLGPDLSAVAYTTADASTSLILTYGDCHQLLEPETGWASAPAPLTDAPLAMELSRYFEQSDPRWEEVQMLKASDTLEGLADDAVAVVEDTMRKVAESSPRLDHKREARTFVLDQESGVFIAWAHGLQRGTTTIDAILEEISTRVGEIR